MRNSLNLGAAGSPGLSPLYITPESALGVAAVYAAVNVISTDISSLPCNVYRCLPDGGKQLERSDLNELLRVAPNDDMDALRFMQSIMNHVLTRGNGYAEIVRNRKGEVRSLELLHPATTVPKRTDGTTGKKGVLYYELENKRKLPAEDCLHFAGMGFNGVIGYSPITICRQTVGLTIGVEQYGASYFNNGAKTSGWIKLSKKLTQTGAENFRNSFNKIHQGSGQAHQIGILEEGTDWVSNSFSPNDGQFLGTRAFQILDIARLFRIPPHKIGDYSQSHRSNVEEANLDYVAMTLAGWVAMLEAQLNSKLLTREQRQQFVISIDMGALLRGNIDARMRRIDVMRNTGAWSVNDILMSEGLNPISDDDGGNLHLVQMQYVPLDQVKKHPLLPRPVGPMPGKNSEIGQSWEERNRLKDKHFIDVWNQSNGNIGPKNAENGDSTHVQG